jgi:hypothetical protein
MTRHRLGRDQPSRRSYPRSSWSKPASHTRPKRASGDVPTELSVRRKKKRASIDHIPHGQGAPLAGKRPYGPASLPLRQLHVNQLHPPSRAALLHVEIESDQRECQRDRLCVFVGLLRCECVYDMLVNKSWITVCEGVGTQFVVRLVR